MSNKKTRITYSGMNQDVSKGNHPSQMYYDARNIKLTPVEGQNLGAVSNAYGNSLVLTIPNPVIDTESKTITAGDQVLPYNNVEVDTLGVSGTQIIIGDIGTKNGFLLYTTDNEGFDCIWEIPSVDDAPLELKLLYVRNLGFSTSTPISGVFNYENSKIQKAYWVDGSNYLRFINTQLLVENGYDINLIDLPASSINSRGSFDTSQPEVISAGGGGGHTSGVIQYGYSMYNLHGSETTISPLSNPYPLDKGANLGGGEVNEVVGAMPIIQIEDLDEQYAFIKLYSVKYTEYNATPEISLIYDGGVGNHTLFTHNDTGTSNLGSVGLAEFVFLGADAVKPKHIASKDSTLFIANNTITAYELEVDTRAYSFNRESTSAKIYNDVVYTGEGEIPYTGEMLDAETTYDIPDKFDCVNLDFDTYRYMRGVLNPDAEVFVEDATYNATGLVSDFSEVYFTNESYSTTIPMTATCDLTNNTPKFEEIGITLPASPITVGNTLVIPADGDYNFSMLAQATVPDEHIGIAGSKMEVIMAVIPQGGVGGYEESIAGISGSNFGGNFQETFTLNVGDVLEFRAKFTYHYNNNYCDTIAYDPVSYTPYDDLEDPFYNPVSPDSGDVAIDISAFSASRGTVVSGLSLPLTATNGETTIVGGELVPNYIGEFRLDITSDVNVNTLPTQSDLFRLEVYENGIVLDSFQLNLNSLGSNSQDFSLIVNSTNVTNTYSLGLSAVALDGYTTDTWDIDVTGTVSAAETTSSGSLGEGGTGKYLSYELTRTEESDVDTRVDKFFKDNEIYRIGVVFRNSIGQESEAKWIADFKASQGNLQKQYNTLKVYFNADFYDYIDTLDDEDKPVGYSILRAVRDEDDKTIVTQGLLTGMMVQVRSRDADGYNSFELREETNPSLLKVPQVITRGYGMGGTIYNSYYPVYPNLHNKGMGGALSTTQGATNGNQINDRISHPLGAGFRVPDEYADSDIASEIFTDDSSNYRTQTAWQFNKLMQLHSPEAAFQFPVVSSNTDQLVILGRVKRLDFEWKEQETRKETLVVEQTTHRIYDYTEVGHFYPRMPGGSGVVGPCYRNWSRDGDTDTGISKRSRQIHTRKTFSSLLRNEKTYDIYGTPEVTEIGQPPKFYNNDAELKYANTLATIITDDKEDEHNRGWTDETGASTVAAEGNRCVTLALGEDNVDTETRLAIEDLYADTSAGSAEWDVELMAEIRKSKEFIYSGAIYGGYDVYSRANTVYVNISTHDIEDSGILLTSPGDTFVQVFKNTRLTRTPGSVYRKAAPIICETLEYLVESQVNLEERNDISQGPWGRVVDPFAEQANNYNRVYSTDPVVKTYKTDNLKINAVSRLETQVMASKVKVPGEFVESWTDFRPNEVQHLDGKYGPINAMVSQWDEIYTFQDFGVARLSINPRVQVQGDDGIAIELGTGQTIHDYQYITTNAGSINKWDVLPSNTGIYFIDATTRQMYRVDSQKLGTVSETKGMHAFFYNNLDRDNLREDNPIEGNGISSGVDLVNGDIYKTVKDKDNGDYTLVFNEKVNAYTSFFDFTPSRYLTKGDKMFTTGPDNNTIWQHYDGNYQTFYGEKYEANITLLINTDEVNAEKVFTNIEFDSEVTLDGVDVAASTIDSIEAWNDYQATNKIPLIVGENMRRRLRTWRALIPREKGSRARMRDKWIYLRLGFHPEENFKLVLHDVIVSYMSQ